MKINHERVCVIADLHFGIHSDSPFWHQVALDWSIWLRDQLIKQDIKDIIICGDVFHDRDEIANNTQSVVSNIFNNWSNFNILITIGNHDCFFRDSTEINSLAPYKNWSNITVFDKTTTIEQFNRKITFVPWGDVFTEKVDVIFGHFEINSFKMNNYKLCEDGLDGEDITHYADLIMSGHFHLRDERRINNSRIIYVGNPFQMDFSDSDTIKGYNILNLKDLSVEFVENTLSPKHTMLTLSWLCEQGKITTEVVKRIKNNLVKFVVDKIVTPEDLEYINKKLKELQPTLLKPEYVINTTGLTVTDNTSILNCFSMEDVIIEFVNLLDINNKDKVIDITLDLYKQKKNEKNKL